MILAITIISALVVLILAYFVRKFIVGVRRNNRYIDSAWNRRVLFGDVDIEKSCIVYPGPSDEEREKAIKWMDEIIEREGDEKCTTRSFHNMERGKKGANIK